MAGIGGNVLFGSVLALGLGAGSASLGACVVESYIPTPKFSPTSSRFDESTFYGRYAKMISNNDPATLLHSDASVLEHKAKLENASAHSDADLWAARKLVESAIHPDTGELIPKPFRMAGYVPFNGPICAAMMVTTSTPMMLFWNWVNQSQNALVNYFNRNASSPVDNQTLAISYAGAVSAALTVAFGLSFGIKKSFTAETANKLLKFVAFPSSMVASCSNCYIMRRPEIDSGIGIVDSNGKKISDFKSKVTAEKAVMETVFSRALLQLPVFLGPALVMSIPSVVRLAKKNPSVNVPIMTLVTMVFFSFGLPATIAVFPQMGTIEKAKLEVELQPLVKEDVAYYNKGL